MGRPAGSVMRCTCTNCGAVEIRTGCNGRFRCVTCGPLNHYSNAHGAVTSAVKAGRMPPARDFACVDCGKPATDYDHRDYCKPLEVEPVCRSCNLKRGPAFDSKHRPASAVLPPSP